LPLTGGVVTTGTTAPVASVIKVIPVVGSVAGSVGFAAIAYASTYAIGRVFTAHFASGGNLLNFDPLQAREAYQDAFEEGKGLAPNAVRP
jgi:uncharacterized protein (DUF697 family)